MAFDTGDLSREPERGVEGAEEQLAIRLAKQLFERLRAQGLDMSNGPCLANEIIPDWAVDVAHYPRQPIDDLPQNQCPSYRSGRVHHFVELDPNGNVIRVK